MFTTRYNKGDGIAFYGTTELDYFCGRATAVLFPYKIILSVGSKMNPTCCMMMLKWQTVIAFVIPIIICGTAPTSCNVYIPKFCHRISLVWVNRKIGNCDRCHLKTLRGSTSRSYLKFQCLLQPIHFIRGKKDIKSRAPDCNVTFIKLEKWFIYIPESFQSSSHSPP